MQTVASLPVFAVIGIAAGFLGGLMGVGGGLIMVPAMTIILGMTQKSAQGISLAAIAPMAIYSFYRYYSMGHVQIDLKSIIALIVAAIIGAQIGTSLMSSMSNKSLQLVFGCFIILCGGMIVYRALR
ncbi:MAG: TSUP family transporter [Fibrobacteres bacterium]|nr:TSUP family transporter [Fibrobacterota bacterium]